MAVMASERAELSGFAGYLNLRSLALQGWREMAEMTALSPTA
jgi:hypothetical protein